MSREVVSQHGAESSDRWGPPGCEVELSSSTLHEPQEALVSHANAVLTPRTRIRLARLIIDSGYSVAAAAKTFMVSPVTARKWAARYRSEGEAGMQDRSSRPHRIPHKTPEATKKRIIALRWRLRLGPAQIAGRLGLAASTVHAVLARCGVNR